MIGKILTWLGVQVPALFTKFGWQAALIVIATVILLALGAVVVLRNLGVM